MCLRHVVLYLACMIIPDRTFSEHDKFQRALTTDGLIKMKQLDIDLSLHATIMTFRLGLTHVTFDLSPSDL